MVPFEPKRACAAEQTLCIHPVRLSMQVVYVSSVPGLGALLVSLVHEHMFLTPSSTSDLF